MITVRGKKHSFTTHERMFLRKCQIFETDNISTWGGLEPPTFGFMLTDLTIRAIRARHLLSHYFEHWLWWYRYLKLMHVRKLGCSQQRVWNIWVTHYINMKLRNWIKNQYDNINRGLSKPLLKLGQARILISYTENYLYNYIPMF